MRHQCEHFVIVWRHTPIDKLADSFVKLLDRAAYAEVDHRLYCLWRRAARSNLPTIPVRLVVRHLRDARIQALRCTSAIALTIFDVPVACSTALLQ